MKHIGLHGDRKVAVMFRQVPGEPQNCLVAYIDSLPEVPRKAINECLGTADAESVDTLADAASRFKTETGEGLLNTIHVGNLLVKVPTTEIHLTPNGRTKVPLNQVNLAIGEIPQPAVTVGASPTAPSSTAALSDEQIATSLRNQASTMKKEADRLIKEADELHPLQKRGRGRPAKVETTDSTV
jgi:hypothetical protein